MYEIFVKAKAQSDVDDFFGPIVCRCGKDALAECVEWELFKLKQWIWKTCSFPKPALNLHVDVEVHECQ
jgi:hypothetical protein